MVVYEPHMPDCLPPSPGSFPDGAVSRRPHKEGGWTEKSESENGGESPSRLVGEGA